MLVLILFVPFSLFLENLLYNVLQCVVCINCTISFSEHNVAEKRLLRTLFTHIGNCVENHFIKTKAKNNSILLASETHKDILCSHANEIPIASNA